jgi:cytochrome c-type biogenesis protein CcmH/NrfG
MPAFRVLAAALAAVVCAAFAIGIRQAISVNAVSALLATRHGLTPSQQRSAASELRSAAFGYPGEDVQILAAQVAIREHRYTRAKLIAESINRAEPDNLQGWIVLAAAGLNIPNRRAALRAKDEEIRLDPIDARPR